MEVDKKDAIQKVVIYARAGNEVALERQVQMLEAHAGRQGWTVYAVYKDIGKGSVRNRKGLSLMVADALSGKFDVLLVAELSRLFRGKDFVPEILNELESRKIGLATLGGLINSDCNPYLLSLMIYSHLAAIEHHAHRIAFAKVNRRMVEI